MKATLVQSMKKHPVVTLFVVLFYVLWIWMMIRDVLRMQHAATSYGYCKYLCYLVDNGCKLVFFTIYFTAARLVYVNKQYSKWFMRLFYVLGIVCFIYFFVSGLLLDYVYNHLGSEYMCKLPSLARTIFLSPISAVCLSFFLIPRVVKDAMKLKEEQELTI